MRKMPHAVDPRQDDPPARAKAIVQSVTHYKDPAALLEVSKSLRGAAMPGLEISKLRQEDLLQNRGW